METTLPALPFSVHAPHRDSDAPHSEKMLPTARPRTDLEALLPWQDFEREVNEVIREAMSCRKLVAGTRVIVGAESEEGLQRHRHERVGLLEATRGVLNVLGCRGKFWEGCHAGVVGAPDSAWVKDGEKRPRILMDYRAEWDARLDDLPASWKKTKSPIRRSSLDDKHVAQALEQLYGYMIFNSHRYGVLTNLARTWFLRREEAGARQTLRYAGPYSLHSHAAHLHCSVLKALVGIVLLADTEPFCPPPTWSIPLNSPVFFAKSQRMLAEHKKAVKLAQNVYCVRQGKDGRYPRVPLDFRLCTFDFRSVRPTPRGCIVNAELLLDVYTQETLPVMCKIVDTSRGLENAAALEDEASAYAALADLQGLIVPHVHGYYTVWGMLHVLALERVGKPIAETDELAPDGRRKIQSVLQHLHAAGYVLGDVSRGMFYVQRGQVRLVDLEKCRASVDVEEEEEEIARIDSL